MDPKMRALVDALRRNYRPPSQAGQMREGQVPPESVPRMSSEDYRTTQFIRNLPAKLPAPTPKAAVVAALLRAGPRANLLHNPVED